MAQKATGLPLASTEWPDPVVCYLHISSRNAGQVHAACTAVRDGACGGGLAVVH